MRLPLLSALAAIVAVVGVVSVQAQDAQAPPVFKSGVDLVRLDVRVVDERGLPVRDLRADELELIEQGQSRPILLFQHIEEPAGGYLEAAARTIGAEVSTNQGAPRGHLYVLLFDQQHLTPGNEQRARLAAQQFLQRRVRPQDRVAISGVPGPGPQLDFTADTRRAIEELEKVRGALDRTASTALGTFRIYEAYQIARGNAEVLTRVALRTTDPAADLSGTPVEPRSGARLTGEDQSMLRRLIAENARTVVAQAEGDARRFLQIATDLMLGLRRIEGRKSVVVFSEGFFVDNLQSDLERLAAAAAQSYSVVYSFDLNRRGPDLREAEALGGEQYSEIQDRIEPLGSLAAETDGELVVNAAEQLDRALNLLADASQDYYIVGFAPAAPDDARGGYRRVTVKVKRAGVRVSTRTGYAIGPAPTPADRRRAIDAALRAPYAQQGLRIDYTTYTLRGDALGAQRVVLVLEAELPVAEPPRAADMVFVVRDAHSGKVAASGTETIPLPLRSARGRSTGVAQCRVQFELPPGSYLMRAVVREPGGLLGSADRRFTVRPIAGPDVGASDLVLGRPGDALPVRPRVYAEGVLTGALEIYGRSEPQLEAVDVRLELHPLGNGADGGTSVAGDLEPIRQTGLGAARAARFELPLTAMSAGAYLARAIVRASGETVAELLREVEVLPGAPPVPTTDVSEPFDPRHALNSSIARDFIVGLRQTAREPAVADAASLGATGAWDGVEQKLGEAPPEAPASHHALAGLARFARADYAGAAERLTKALAAEPRNAAVAFLLGWAHEAAGDHRSAITAWRNAVLADPRLVPAHLALAEVYEHQLAEPALAIQVLRAGLNALPNSPELRDRLAELESRVRRRQ